ncbi:MAG: OadG family transporter subunit [Paludibacteraceae bacterium]
MIMLATNWTNVLIMTGVGIGVVFIVLVLLVFILQLFGAIATTDFKKKNAKTVSNVANSTTEPQHSASDAEKAAIAMALHLYFAEVHDTESYRLTIRQNANSAWSSKLYGMNNLNK